MSYNQLTEGQRYQIYALIERGIFAKIADNIECHPSICRELKRNRGKKGYRHKQANKLAVERRQTAINPKVDSTCQGLGANLLNRI